MKNYSAEEKSYIWLDAFPLSVREKNKLLQTAGSATRLVRHCAEILENTVKDCKSGVYKDMVDSLKSDVFFKKNVERFESRGIEAIPRVSEGFFPEWAQAEHPPLVQYEKGNAALKKRDKFAIVGSRRTPPESMKRAEEIAQNVSERFSVVTGCADGGDEAAKRGAAECGGAIVVLPGGFSVTESFSCDFSKHLYVTEQAYDFPAMKYSYERRNYLLAALSKGALVVSAGKKSGALITAKYVAEAKKPLFAFPYSLGVPSGIGCNSLIKSGAFLAENADDIFAKFGIAPQSEKNADNERLKQEKALTAEEERLLQALQKTGKANVNALALETGIPAWKISSAVVSLEVKGLIVRTGGNGISLV